MLPCIGLGRAGAHRCRLRVGRYDDRRVGLRRRLLQGVEGPALFVHVQATNGFVLLQRMAWPLFWTLLAIWRASEKYRDISPPRHALAEKYGDISPSPSGSSWELSRVEFLEFFSLGFRLDFLEFRRGAPRGRC